MLLVPLGLALLIFVTGGCNCRAAHPRPSGAGLFLAGWAVLTLALVSPLHEAGEHSFTMHMIEHELIMLVATLLLASSNTGGVLAWGLPKPLRLSLAGGWKSPLQSLWKRLTEPITATAIQGVVMWVWHAPPCSTGRSKAPAGTSPSMRAFSSARSSSGGRCSIRAPVAATESRRRAFSSLR